MGNIAGHVIIAALAFQGSGDLTPGQVVDIVQMALVSFVMIVLGLPFAIGIARRFLQRPVAPPAVSPDVTARLERIEQAVDTISIEVERMAEAQRFSAKLLAGRAADTPDAGRLKP